MRTEQGVSFVTFLLHDVSLQAKEIPGIKIFRSSTAIYYINAEMYLEALQEKVCVCVSMNVDVCLCTSSYLITRYYPCPLSTAPLIAFIISLACLTFSSLSCDARLFVQSGIEIGKLLMAKKKEDAKLKRKQQNEKKKAKKEAKKQV